MGPGTSVKRERCVCIAEASVVVPEQMGLAPQPRQGQSPSPLKGSIGGVGLHNTDMTSCGCAWASEYQREMGINHCSSARRIKIVNLIDRIDA